MKESTDKKTRLVFTDGNLTELQDAIVEAFEVFHQILDEPCSNYDDLQQKLENVDDGTWSTIRDKYLSDHKQRGTDNNNVVVLMLDFVATIDKCTRALRGRLEERDSHVTEMEGKVKTMEEKETVLEERLHEKDQLLTTKMAVHAETLSANSGLAAKNAYMQKLLDDKHKRISEIEELENLLDDYKHGRESAIQKLRDTDNLYKKRLFREQVREQHEQEQQDVSRLSRENYVQDKDIVYLEKQLYDLQAHTVGFMGGMKTDFNKLCRKFVNPDEGGVDKDFLQLSSRMTHVHDAMASGSVEKVRDSLPPHYKYYDQEKVTIRRIKRLSHPTMDTTQMIVAPSVRKSNESKPKLSKITENNPVIVNPRTKKLHTINSVKYFGHMSQKFMLEQFEQFNEFDNNGDGALDLTEVVKIVSQLGFTFNVHELQEAMEEVDRDGNHTLDFYEYLLIIDNLYRKSGKAQLFKDGINQINKNAASKSCSIQ